MPVPIDNRWQSSVIVRNVPDALWGQPFDSKTSNSSDSLLDRNLVENCWVGLKVQTPEAEAGTTLGPIDIKNTLGEAPVGGSQQQNGCLPLKMNFPAQSQPEFNSQSLETVIADTKSGIAVVGSQRNIMVDSLKKLGIFKPLTQLNDMTLMAESADQIFLAPPLIVTPPTQRRNALPPSTLWTRPQKPQPILTSSPLLFQ